MIKAQFYLKPAWIILVSAWLFIGCTGNTGNGIKTTIQGSFPAFKGSRVALSEIGISSTTPIDTAVVSDNGSFTFRFNRTGPGFYLIKLDNRNYLTLILDQERKISVFSDGREIRKGYRVEGSPDSELYSQFEQFLDVNRKKVDSLRTTYTSHQRSPGFQSMQLQLDDAYQRIFSHQRQFSVNYVLKNCTSLSSLLVINRRFGERLVITPDEDLHLMQHLDSCLTARYPGNIHLEDHKKRLKTAEERYKIKAATDQRLAIGNKAPDIDMEDPEGRTVTLYSLEGKPVVVYFWASWENGCKTSNRALKEFLDNHGGKKPEVYAVGLESYRDLWKSAIERDGTQAWKHVTDYLNVYSSARSRYNVPDKLPYFFLLDDELKIRYKGGSLQELFSAIKELPS